MKDVTRDLAADDVRRLSLFYTPRNIEDLERLVPLAIEWMRETVEPLAETSASGSD